jgi:hypothetical protein
VKALESRVAWLETQHGPSLPAQSRDHLLTEDTQATSGVQTSNPASITLDSASPNLANSVGLLSLRAGGGDPQYFGVSSGVSLARMIETAVYENARPSNLKELADMNDSSFPGDDTGAQTKVAPLPSPEVGAPFVTAYLSYIQPNFPFIPKSTLWEAHQNCKAVGDTVTGEAKHKLVMILLIYAIGSRCLQLVGSTNATDLDPDGYYCAAMAMMQDQLNLPSIQNIEIVLLVAIYALRSPSSRCCDLCTTLSIK